MKKWILMMVCLMLALYSPAAMADLTAQYRAEMQSLIASSGDKLWQWRDGTLTVWKEDQAFREVSNLGGVQQLAACGEYAYCLMGQGNRVHIRQIDEMGNAGAVYPISAEWYIRQMEADEENLYILAETGEYAAAAREDVQAGSRASVYCLPLDGSADARLMACEGWDNEGVSCISIGEGVLAAYEGFDPTVDQEEDPICELAVLSLAENRLCYAPVNLIATEIEVMGFDGDELYVYALMCDENMAELFSVNASNGRVVPEACYVAPWEILTPYRQLPQLPEICGGLQLVQNRIWTQNGKTGELVSFQARQAESTDFEKKLVLMDCDIDQYPSFAMAVSKFHEKYPDMEIVIHSDRRGEDVVELMRAGAAGVDLIFENNTMTYYPEQLLMREGMLVDLAQCPEIAELLPEYLDVFEPHRVGEALYAVPTVIWPTVLRYKADLLEDIGIRVPEPGWTWEDLLTTMAEMVNDYNAWEGKEIALLCDAENVPLIIESMNVNAVDWETGEISIDPKWAELLDVWNARSERSDERLIRKQGKRLYDGTMPPNALFSVAYGVTYGNLEDDSFVPAPVLAEGALVPGVCHHMMINENSAHREEAIWFLHCLMHPDTVRATSVLETGQLLKSAEDYAESEFMIEAPSEENAALWPEMVKNCAQQQALGELYRTQMQQYVPALHEGAITGAEFIDGMRRELEQFLAEIGH